MTIDDVNNSWREASLLDKFPHDQHGQRCLLCQLEHHSVTAAKCGTQLPTSHRQREVPWDDLAADTEGLLQGICELGRANVNDLAKVLVCVAGVVLEDIHNLGHILIERRVVWLAIVKSLDRGQNLCVLLDQPG